MENKIRIKCSFIVFDMDGVITNTMPDHFRAWVEILKDEGIHVTRYDVYSREGQRGISSVQEILGSHGRSCSPSQARGLLQKKEELFKKIVKVRFIPGARNFLKYLHRAGFGLALVTGTARHELQKILPKKIYQLFCVVVTADETKVGKPDPEPFLLALEKLNIPASRAVVIENAPFGIRSAKAADIRCLALETSLPREHLKGADHIFSSIRELRDKIDFICEGK